MSRTIVSYQYQPLDVAKKEIRLLHLYPGGHNDPIQLSISHIHFDPEVENELSHNINEKMKEVQKTLPKSWTAYRTLAGAKNIPHGLILSQPRIGHLILNWKL
jgi:hypothetical protein